MNSHIKLFFKEGVVNSLQRKDFKEFIISLPTDYQRGYAHCLLDQIYANQVEWVDNKGYVWKATGEVFAQYTPSKLPITPVLT